MLRSEGVSFYILSIYRGHLAGILFHTLTLIPRSGLKGAGCTNYLLGWRLLAFPLLAKASFGIKGKGNGIFGKGGERGEWGRGEEALLPRKKGEETRLSAFWYP